MLERLGLDSREVPSSNVVFVQSRGEKELALEKGWLLESCWPLHQARIDNLNIRAILCFGRTAGTWVRSQLGADELIDCFTEANYRGWTSRTHRNEQGRQVITATHPSRVDWRNSDADPSPLVQRAIARVWLQALDWPIEEPPPSVPPKCGNSNAICRFRRWSEAGVWEAVSVTLAEIMADRGHYSIDSITVRAHVSTAGGKRGLIDKVLAAHWAGSSFNVWLRPEDGHSPSA